MFTLDSPLERKAVTREICERRNWYEVWNMMNEIKPLNLIPGLNMITIYQLSDYFEIPIRQIRAIEQKYAFGGLLDSRSDRDFISSKELSFLALSKQKVKYEGVCHWQYNFKNFSIHAAAPGAICYSPRLTERFVPYINGSEVCSQIICKLIKSAGDSFYFEGEAYMRYRFEEYEKEQQRLAEEREQKEKVKQLVEEVLSDKNADQLMVKIQLIMNA